MAIRDSSHARRLTGVGLVLLCAALAVDFHLDVHNRDAFSWMDPYQYYDFALAVLQGRERFDGFEVPSIFPFFLLPTLSVSPSIPAALWSNFGFTLLLVAGIHGLCRAVPIETRSPIVAILAFSSPLLIGLSRTLYVEYALAAVVTWAFLLWLRFVRAPGWASGAKFGAAFALGFMLKMTFPIFFALPAALVAIDRLARRRTAQGVGVIAATAVPFALVIWIQSSVFPRSFGYYLSLGNTALPIMRLIGPFEWSSWSSVTFYFGELGRTMLFLLTPFLFVAALRTWRETGRPRGWDPADAVATLWLWLLGPLVLLIAEPVKEPRHVAPCVVPAVLLVAHGIDGLPSGAPRAVARAMALSMAVLQLAAVTVFRMETPYFLDGRLDWEQVADRMVGSRRGADPSVAETEPDPSIWNYEQNIALRGFSANEALAWTWHFFPAVVFDLETFAEPERPAASVATERFEDLYVLAAFDTYNRRCGWRHRTPTLSRETVIDNADFVIAKEASTEAAAREFPGHVLVASIPRDDGTVRVLRSRRLATRPYREIWARSFLERNPALPPSERLVVANELLQVAALGPDGAHEAEQVLREFPALRRGATEVRNIYWIAGYDTVAREALERIRNGMRR